MFRYALLIALLGWQWPSLAQTGEVPGMPADPTAAKPPPDIPDNQQPDPGQKPLPSADKSTDGETDDEAVPRPPVLPEPMESGDAIEPEVTIIQEDDRKIEEYRLNGRLYMVKVTPSVGPPYYFVDRDGDGTLESRKSGVETPQVPQWVIFRW